MALNTIRQKEAGYSDSPRIYDFEISNIMKI